MTRILRYSASCFKSTLFLLCSASLFATDADESLIERLEAAETSRQKHDVLDAVHFINGSKQVEEKNRILSKGDSSGVFDLDGGA